MFGKNQIITRDGQGRFKRADLMINNYHWLYQKYVVNKLTWDDFYKKYSISPTLLQNRLKKFGIKRERNPWNKGTKGVMKPNKTSFTKEMVGEKSANWKGGVTPRKLIIRGSPEYKKWREDVFKRDRYRCVSCGTKMKIQAHHIKPFATYVHLRFDIDNGRTLCFGCHRKTEREERGRG